VWKEVERVLRDPSAVLAEIKRHEFDAGADSDSLRETGRLRDYLTTLDESETRFLRLYGAGVVAEEKLQRELLRVADERRRTAEAIASLESRLAKMHANKLSGENIEVICKRVSTNLESLSTVDRRMALEALDIKVHVNGDSISVTGSLPALGSDVVSPSGRMEVDAGHVSDSLRADKAHIVYQPL